MELRKLTNFQKLQIVNENVKRDKILSQVSALEESL